MDDVGALAAEFGRTQNLERMREIVVALAKPGATNKAGEKQEFQRGLLRLGQLAIAGKGEERLQALALLARISSQPSKALRNQINLILSVAAPPIEAPASFLKNPQDREYLARSLHVLSFSEKGYYLAAFAASEGQTATNARNLAVEYLLRHEGMVETAIDLLSTALFEAPISTQDVGTSRARRLSRCIEALERAIGMCDPEVTAEAGPALARMVEAGLHSNHMIEREAAIELASAVFSALLSIVRPNFSCARDPVIFEPIETIRKLFTPARWPDETLPGRRALATLIKEIIALLAPAGMTDNRLRSMLINLLGDVSAEAWLKSMAQIPGLSTEVRHWILRGRALKSFAGNEAAGETILEGIEKDLADACREAEQLSRVWLNLRDEIAEVASNASPPLGRGVGGASDRIDRVTRRLMSLARRRGFEFEYDVGDAVEYLPAEHEASRPIEGLTMVRIVAPKVVRRVQNGVSQLVLKAKVEPV